MLRFLLTYLLLGLLTVFAYKALTEDGRKDLNKLFWDVVFYGLLTLAWPVLMAKAIFSFIHFRRSR